MYTYELIKVEDDYELIKEEDDIDEDNDLGPIRCITYKMEIPELL